MPHRITHIAPLSLARVLGAVYFVLGLLFAIFLIVASVVDGDEEGPSIGLAIAIPILYGVGGFVASALVAALYNAVAARLGGIELEIVSVSERP